MLEKQKKSKGSTGETLLKLLEMRLDNIVFRLGMAPTIMAARQLISHGHIVVNQNSVTIPSYQCQTKDMIQVKVSKTSRKMVETNVLFSDFPPEHLSFNKETLVGNINNEVNRNWIALQINELLVVEYYSRKL